VRVGDRPQLPPGPYLVVGLARSGTAAARALAARGEPVIGVDAAEPAGAGGLRELGVELHLGGSATEALLDRVGTVVKSPGVPGEDGLVAAARAREMTVMGELELGWRLLANEFVAVTGTNGKTTTVEMIAHVLRTAGRAAAVAGNVGTAVCSLVDELDGAVTVVCEVSSFQLEDAIAFAPETAVLLNVFADHLDRHGTIEDYEAAKLRIFAAQGPGDTAVVPQAMLERVRGALAAGAGLTSDVMTFGAGERASVRTREGELWWGERKLLGAGELRVRGAHNLENAMAAAAACLARGASPEAVSEGLRSFAGVAHRLEPVATRAGTTWVNDSKATNVASTLVALAAFAGQPVHLILGGQGKGQDFAPLREPVRRGCAAVYLIGEDACAIAGALAGTGVPLRDCGALEEAVRACAGAAKEGEIVLLSPACASFDQFADFEARGERFRALAREDHDDGPRTDAGTR
jgi:UDP-N-acetylmuramoylalanine--D-glutamate ligase